MLFSGTVSVAFAQTSSTPFAPTSCSQMGIGQGASLNGFVPFPTNDPFNQNITSLPVDPSSAAILGPLWGAAVHPDFGGALLNGVKNGIPYQVVSGQPSVPVVYNTSPTQSDAGPMPIPANAPIEGAGAAGYSDHHVLVLDQSNCFLYELYQGVLQGDGSWQAASGAIWDLLNDNARPYTWTSADAAGLPIFPGLIRYDEVASGAIRHAIRFTLANTRDEYVLPATHQASNSVSPARAALGARLRLRADFDISSYSHDNQVILQAMKTYGLILADNGSNMYVSGVPDSRWNDTDLRNLGYVHAQDFDLVTTGPLLSDNNLPVGAPPEILALTGSVQANQTFSKFIPGLGVRQMVITTLQALAEGTTVTRGTPVKLTWAAAGASYYVLTPGSGAVRGTSVTVTPTQTTTYTLYANSHFGSDTKTFTVTVH